MCSVCDYSGAAMDGLDDQILDGTPTIAHFEVRQSMDCLDDQIGWNHGSCIAQKEEEKCSFGDYWTTAKFLRCGKQSMGCLDDRIGWNYGSCNLDGKFWMELRL